MKVKICIVTGSRAEYGLFYPLLKRIKREPLFQLQIAVCGMHLSCVFGLTYKEIIGDGFSIDERVKIPLVNDTAEGIAKSVGIGVIGFAPVFKRLNPDFAILLGDRFETYSAAIAAFLARIPIIHLYGGELTEGVVDDAFRHSITKMSILHFTSTESYRQRVIQLGEHPRRVFTVGGICGLDSIDRAYGEEGKTKRYPKYSRAKAKRNVGYEKERGAYNCRIGGVGSRGGYDGEGCGVYWRRDRIE